jgi:hypothetical protein
MRGGDRRGPDGRDGAAAVGEDRTPYDVVAATPWSARGKGGRDDPGMEGLQGRLSVDALPGLKPGILTTSIPSNGEATRVPYAGMRSSLGDGSRST